MITPLHKSPGTIRKHRQNHTSRVNTTACFQPPSSNMQGILDPWYLQTDFLLSPVVIPSGYCTWVPTPDQQMYSRGDLVLGDWEQHQSVSREESDMERAEEGAGTGDGDATQTLRQTTQTRTGVVDGETVTTTTTITAATKITKEQGDVQEHLEKSLDKDKSRKPE